MTYDQIVREMQGCIEDAGHENIVNWQFPIVFLRYSDGDAEVVPQAYMSDVSWCNRGRDKTVVATFDRDQYEEFIAANYETA